MFRRFFAWTSRYERPLSAAAMIVSAIIDQVFFGRVDLVLTQLVFESYVVVCILAIAWLHVIEVRIDRGAPRPRWRPLLTIAIQFSLGGFWSGFLVFYGRSAALAASWPFLVLIVAILVANEVLKKYHDRLIFTNVLFFFALYSYAIFAVPVYFHAIGSTIFLASGAFALAVFALFQFVLYLLGRVRYRASARGILLGTALVLFLMNLFYFANILPPLPLALKDAGVYHAVTRVSGGYQVTGEAEPWYAGVLGIPAAEHVVAGESLYVYSAVFAPTALATTIIHEWQWYDPEMKAWTTRAAIAYPIVGGRDGGYKGYSTVANPIPGSWRVNIKTVEGLLIGRVTFTVTAAALPPAEVTKII